MVGRQPWCEAGSMFGREVGAKGVPGTDERADLAVRSPGGCRRHYEDYWLGERSISCPRGRRWMGWGIPREGV